MQRSVISLAVFFGFAAHAGAATLYWDLDGATPGFAANTAGGTWHTSNWSTDPAGASATGAWADGNIAFFEGTGTWTALNLASDVTVAGLEYGTLLGTPRVTLGSTGGTLNLSGDVIAPSNQQQFITAPVLGSFTKRGTGILQFNVASYSGTITIEEGVVGNNGVNALGTSVNVTANGGEFRVAGASVSIGELRGTSTSLIGVGALGSGRSLSVTQNVDTTFSGNINPNSNTNNANAIFSISKAGTGTLMLNGASITHDGGMTVTDGKLLLNGTWAQDGNGSSAPGVVANLTVNGANAFFGGAGTVRLANARIVDVQNGTVAPGGATGTGMLTIDLGNTTGGMVMAAGTEFAFDLGSPGIGDVLRFLSFGSGDLTLNSNAIDFTNVGGLAAGTYTLMSFYSDAGTTLTDTGKPLSGLVIGSGLEAFPDSYLDYSSTGQVRLVVVIPEPGSALLAGAGLAAMGLRRRR